MKKQLVLFPIFLASLLTAFSAQAANTADLKVIGSVLPSACEPSLIGSIDYGRIPISRLKPKSFTILEKKSIALNLQCSGPSKVAMKFVDNRAHTRVELAGYAIKLKNTKDWQFGLGEQGGKHIGSFVMTLAPNALLDNNPKDILTSSDQVDWVTDTDGTIGTRSRYYSFGTKQSPEFFTNLAATLEVQAAVNNAEKLSASDEIVLDGSVTIEFMYL